MGYLPISDYAEAATTRLARFLGSVAAAGFAGFTGLLQELPDEGLLFAVGDGGRLLEVFALLPLADDALFLDHALETLDGLLERLVVVHDYLLDKNHPPSKARGSLPGRMAAVNRGWRWPQAANPGKALSLPHT